MTTPIESAKTAQRYRHVKRGSTYKLVGIGKMQAAGWVDYTTRDGPVGPNAVDMREVAIYRSEDDHALWVRPREEFEDGRFEALKDLEGSAQGGVRVRELEWTTFDADREVAHTPIGSWMTDGLNGTFTVEYRGALQSERYATVDEAKAAAQADFERRILSALSASPPIPVHQVDAEAVAWQERECFHGHWSPWVATSHEAFLEWQNDPSLHAEHEARALFANPQPQETVETLKREVERLTNVLTKIDAIRNSIIGFQTVGWSEHIYPLVAALQDAGFEGQGYEDARENASSLLAVTEAAETRATNAETRIAELEKENGRKTQALTKIAAFDDANGNAELAACDSYSAFDEPHSVRLARAALAPDASTIEGAGL